MSIIFNSSVYYGFINNINPEEITDSAETEEELLDLCKFTNLQPLCSYTNRYIKKHYLGIGQCVAE